jgi:hypothetical protein
MIRQLTLAVASTLTLVSPVFAADPYPRTGAILTGGAQNYWDSTFQSQMAKLQVVILTSYPGWGSGHGTTMEKAVQQLKARNSNLKVFLYVKIAERQSPVPSLWPGLGSKLDGQNWWLYQTWGASTKVASDCGGGKLLNVTSYSNKDSSGLHYNEWVARYMATQIGNATPSATGLFTDCVFWRPRTNGDWNQDGKTDSATNAAVGAWMREGYARYADELHAAMPGKLQLANVADWGKPEAVITEYQGEFNGGVLEGMIGKSYSREALTGGWQLMMTAYRKTMSALASPKLGIFVMTGSITDYQGMRYGLASTSMDDGYFAFQDQAQIAYSTAVHFDEYDAKLGSATSGPQKSAWQSGVYRRDFQNGIILVNPKGNGTRTVTLETNFRKLKGSQAPSVNNGQLVKSVTLKDRDGLILLRN